MNGKRDSAMKMKTTKKKKKLKFAMYFMCTDDDL